MMSNSVKIYRLRIVLDAEEDVIRDIEIPDTASLQEFHESILRAFDLQAGEMATFYNSNANWDQLEEINLLDFGGAASHAREMRDVTVDDYLFSRGSRMIYVYDLLNLWTFFIENIGETTADTEEPNIIHIKGERPAEAPPKNMEGSGGHDLFKDQNGEGEDDYYEDDEEYY